MNGERKYSDSNCLSCIYSNTLMWWASLIVITILTYVFYRNVALFLLPLFAPIPYYTYVKARRFEGYRQEAFLYIIWAFIPLSILGIICFISFYYLHLILFIVSLLILMVSQLYTILVVKGHYDPVEMSVCYIDVEEDIQIAESYSFMMRKVFPYVWALLSFYLVIPFYDFFGFMFSGFLLIVLLIVGALIFRAEHTRISGKSSN